MERHFTIGVALLLANALSAYKRRGHYVGTRDCGCTRDWPFVHHRVSWVNS